MSDHSTSPQPKKVRIRAGMTMIELLVAVALSAILLGSLVGVLGGVAKQAKLAESYDQPIWPMRLLALVRRDLIAAESLWIDRREIRLRTDAPSYQSDGKGLRGIVYRCSRLSDGTSVLERIDDGIPSVLAIGPNRITLERLDSAGVPQPLPPSPGPVPSQIRVWVWQADRSAPVVVRDLVLR